MEWVKSHLTVVIVSAISFLAVVLMALGFILSEASATMQKNSVASNNRVTGRRFISVNMVV